MIFNVKDNQVSQRKVTMSLKYTEESEYLLGE
jgi:hypothetical protein